MEFIKKINFIVGHLDRYDDFCKAPTTHKIHEKTILTAKQMLYNNNKVQVGVSAQEVETDDAIAKVSIVGVGMRSHAGVAAKMFEILAAENINIQLITTSEIKIAVVVEERYLELAVRTLHTGFGLDSGA